LQRSRNNSKISIVSKARTHEDFIVSEKELQKLYKNFSKIDKDKSGMLEPEEFFDIPGMSYKDYYNSDRACVKSLSPSSHSRAGQEQGREHLFP
jgi:Ca2+-binding EF-hand superfamily protein